MLFKDIRWTTHPKAEEGWQGYGDQCWSQGFRAGKTWGRVVKRHSPGNGKTVYALRVVRGQAKPILIDICNDEFELAIWLAAKAAEANQSVDPRSNT